MSGYVNKANPFSHLSLWGDPAAQSKYTSLLFLCALALESLDPMAWEGVRRACSWDQFIAADVVSKTV